MNQAWFVPPIVIPVVLALAIAALIVVRIVEGFP